MSNTTTASQAAKAASIMHASQSLQHSGQPFTPAARGKLVTFIHEEGGIAFLRPLTAEERLRALGYPAHAAAADDRPCEPGSEEDFAQCSLAGNAFPLTVVSAMLRPFVETLAAGRIPAINQSALRSDSVDKAMSILHGEHQQGDSRH